MKKQRTMASEPEVDRDERPSGMKLSLDMELTAFPEFPPLQNDLILRAACKLPTERVPIWVMRQVYIYTLSSQD